MSIVLTLMLCNSISMKSEDISLNKEFFLGFVVAIIWVLLFVSKCIFMDSIPFQDEKAL
jgi:hypothetical protein